MLKFGFYDSSNGDRAYNADDMSRIFDGIIRDGVYQYCDDHMEITPENDENGFGVNIAAGRAWFNRTWTYVDSPLFLRVDQNHSGATRYDFVALVIDKRASARQNFFVICKGSPNYSGTVVEGQVFVHFFAKIKIVNNATVLQQSDITSYEGVAEFEYEGTTYPGAPWVTGPLETISIDDLIAGWTEDMHDAIDAAIDDYFDGLTVATKPADLGQGYGVCTTDAATSIKTVAIDGFKLTNGGIVAVKFLNGFQAGCRLNINDTGEKYIYYGVSPIGNNLIRNSSIATLVYDASLGFYRVLSIDSGINGETDIDNVIYVPIQNQGGQLVADLTSVTVYNAVVRDEKNILYCLVDPTNRLTPYAIASLAKKPTVNTEAIFTAIDPINNVLYVYTLSAAGIVTWEAHSIGSYSKPNTGIPETDLANDIRKKLTNAGMGQGYGVCTTNKGIYYKTVSLEGYELEVGGIVAVWFADDIWGILSHDITLNINNKGDKPIYYQGSPITSGLVHANDIVTMIYDGNYYHVISINQFSKNEIVCGTLWVNDNDVLECSLTHAEIYDAVHHNKFVVLNEAVRWGNEDCDRYYIFSDDIDSDDDLTFINIQPYSSIGYFTVTRIVIDDDEHVTKTTYNRIVNAAQGFGYATCSTAAATIAKEATLGHYSLVDDSFVAVKFTYAVPTNATLSINGATAKNIRYHGSNITSGIIQAGDIATFVYDGEYYHLISIDRQQSGGTGAEIFEVDFSISGSIASCDKAYSDILDAEAADNIIIPRYDGLQGIYLGGDNGTKVQFMFFDNRVAGSNPESYIFTIDSYNNVSFVVRTMSFDPAVVTVSGDTPNIVLAQDNIVYDLTGTGITSVTITAREAGAAFSVLFNTPAGLTAPTFLYPTSNMYMPDNFALDVYRHYEINVDSRGFATVNSWPLD